MFCNMGTCISLAVMASQATQVRGENVPLVHKHLCEGVLKGRKGLTLRGALRRLRWMARSSIHSAAKARASATIATTWGLPMLRGRARTPAEPTWLLSSVLLAMFLWLLFVVKGSALYFAREKQVLWFPADLD